MKNLYKKLHDFYTFSNSSREHTDWIPNLRHPLFDSIDNYHLLESFARNSISDGLNCSDVNRWENDDFFKEYLQDLKSLFRVHSDINESDIPANSIGRITKEEDSIYPLYYKWSINLTYLKNKCLNNISEQNKSVLEIGAGFGGFSHLFCKNISNLNYVIVDIPETSIISSYFLIKNGMNVVLPNEYEDINKEIKKTNQITFVLPRDVEKIDSKSIDLIINMDGLVEMGWKSGNTNTMDHYLKQINRICKKYFWHSNSSGNVNYPHLISKFKKISGERFELIDDSFVPQVNTNEKYDEEPYRFNYILTMERRYKNILYKKNNE